MLKESDIHPDLVFDSLGRDGRSASKLAILRRASKAASSKSCTVFRRFKARSVFKAGFSCAHALPALPIPRRLFATYFLSEVDQMAEKKTAPPAGAVAGERDRCRPPRPRTSVGAKYPALPVPPVGHGRRLWAAPRARRVPAHVQRRGHESRCACPAAAQAQPKSPLRRRSCRCRAVRPAVRPISWQPAIARAAGRRRCSPGDMLEHARAPRRRGRGDTGPDGASAAYIRRERDVLCGLGSAAYRGTDWTLRG